MQPAMSKEARDAPIGGMPRKKIATLGPRSPSTDSLRARTQIAQNARSMEGTCYAPLWRHLLLVALAAAPLGFGGIAAGAAAIAQGLSFAFLVPFPRSLVVGLIRRGSAP